MTIASMAEFRTAIQKAVHICGFKTIPNPANRLGSSWIQAALAGATPTASVALDNTSTGALNLGSIVGAEAGWQLIAANAVTTATHPHLILADRLVHQGGLSGTVTTAQTTNLPTAALPSRATGGAGVFMAYEIYALIGTTITTVTCSYTNQAGTAGRTSQATIIGGNSTDRDVGALRIMPFQDGDTGCRSVESVTVLASTGTAGNFGITLFKPIAFLNPMILGIQNQYGSNNYSMAYGAGFQPGLIPNGCCLWLCGNGGAVFNAQFDLSFAKP